MAARHANTDASKATDPHLYAWDVENEHHIRVAAGSQDELRSRCHDGLVVCQFAGCEASITPVIEHTRAGARVRAHFRHPRLDGLPTHSPESIRHFTGKWLVHDWLLAKHPSWTVEVERKVGNDLYRRPDVKATTGEGRDLAVEVQFSSLGRDLWIKRSLFLHGEGFQPIWLWGSPSEYFQLNRGPADGDRTVRLEDRVLFSWRVGEHPLWIDPEQETIVSVPAAGPGPGDNVHPVIASPLTACDIEIVPSGRRFGRRYFDSDVWFGTSVGRHHMIPPDEKRIRFLEEIEAGERERALFAKADALTDRSERQEAYRQIWIDSDLHERVIDRFGKVPEILTTRTRGDDVHYFHPQHWKAKLVMGLIQGGGGKSYDFRDFIHVLRRGDHWCWHYRDAVIEFLILLRDRGFVSFKGGRGFIDDGIVVRADAPFVAPTSPAPARVR